MREKLLCFIRKNPRASFSELERFFERELLIAALDASGVLNDSRITVEDINTGKNSGDNQ